jgi:hypothetical protein
MTGRLLARQGRLSSKQLVNVNYYVSLFCSSNSVMTSRTTKETHVIALKSSSLGASVNNKVV